MENGQERQDTQDVNALMQALQLINAKGDVGEIEQDVLQNTNDGSENTQANVESQAFPRK